jgi:gliding motility-associated-like protein
VQKVTVKINYLLYLFVFINFQLFGQVLFYSDIFHGGVTAGGFSGGLNGIGSGTVNLYIEPGSTIKKTFVFTFRTGKYTSEPININGINYFFDSSNVLTSFSHPSPVFTPIYINCIDITSILNVFQTSSFSITISPQPKLPYEGVFAPFIYIAYENPTLPVCNTNIIINEHNLVGDEVYSVNNLNPINTLNPVGFSLYTDRSGAFNAPDQRVFFNSNLLGIIGGNDNVNSSSSIGAGVKGHFYYQNNQLFGLDDDTPDAIMDSTDGLADVSIYLSNNATSCNFELKNINYPNQGVEFTCVNLAYFLTYTTPCDTFSVNLLTEDTTICQGASVQLGVSGGNTSLSKPAYEWLPQKDLSCYNCANPVFSGDSSQVYTVRIWNTDSCSKVLPVRVKVLPPPQFTSVVTTPTACGDNTGKLVAKSNNATDSLFLGSNFVGFAPQTLPNMGGGNYTLFLKDTSGCASADTTVTVNSVISTTALFTLNPSTGAAPLAVNSTNQSTHATNYNWYFQNDSSHVFEPNFSFDTSGTYTVTLIAYNNDPACSDTFSLQVVVYDSLQIVVPNVITPNQDGINDIFSVQVNAPCSGTITITNRWGNVVHTQDFSATTKQKIQLWNAVSNGQSVSDGTYFYLLKLQDEQGKSYALQGFVAIFY